MTAGGTLRTAPDGSPYPDRASPEFERGVQAMFAHIAEGYEALDHLASLGQDFVWRPLAIWTVDRYRAGRPVDRVVDVGCGTGEFTRLEAHHYPEARVTGVDFTEGMLRRARLHGNEEGRVAYCRGSALALPVSAGAVDLCSSAFLLRNLADLARGFREMRRVLRPGGTLVALEITEPENPRLGALFHAYFDRVVPALGAAVGSAGPYRYLPESLRHLPPRAEILRLLTVSGLERPCAVPLSGGVVTAYVAAAPERL
ncbi:MAG: ubiquinone/menaquinone biosynthesis methyltransferase [Thermoplasmata archaeon]|nr:ubiquinone/menaquinone biosynthesis methyltransferase [Thermoplasmata archaeon]